MKVKYRIEVKSDLGKWYGLYSKDFNSLAAAHKTGSAVFEHSKRVVRIRKVKV